MLDFNGKRNLFSKNPNKLVPLRVFLLLVMILAGLFVIRALNTGQIQPMAVTTPTPTRTFNSYAQEGETHFSAGNLEKAIEAYRSAVNISPNDPDLRAELARIQVFSTSQLTVDAEKKTRLDEALATIDEGLKTSPQSSQLHAVKAFALDWYGNSSIAGENCMEYLIKGEQSAVEALQYDNQNALDMAYYAELLEKKKKWTQANTVISQALVTDDTLMDVHRVNGYVQESLSNYSQAITEYERAIEITPNMNFLYISLGANYRKLATLSSTDVERDYYYGLALEAFAKAVNINDQLGVNDPIPLISIANTYVQQGEFFAAARNVLKALQFRPNDPTVYGTLGVVYYKARNYEGSILPLRCAVRGCTAEESCLVRNRGAECDANEVPDIVISALPLSTTTAIYYYIYGSVLAGLHQTSNGYCEEAMQVFDEITAGFGGDETIMSIVREGVAICNFYGYQ